MPLAAASVPSPDPHASYLDHLERSGRGNTAYWQAARTFFRRWPQPAAWAAEPLEVRLSANSATRPIITFLMLHQGLRPGYDYLLDRKLSSIWREIKDSPLAGDLEVFNGGRGGTGVHRPGAVRHWLPGPGPVADPDRPAPGPAHCRRLG